MTDSFPSQKSVVDKNDREVFLKMVGVRVRQFREQKKWTQEKLAQEAKINDKYVYDIETGNKCMSIWVLTKISKALEVDIVRLLIDEEDIN